MRTLENIILILAVLGMVAATSLSGWMNKKTETSAKPAAPTAPTINVAPAPPIVIYPNPGHPIRSPNGTIWKL